MDDQNNITKYVAMKEDITLRKQAEAELRETNRTLALQLQEIELLQKELKAQALHDPHTGLYNRRYLNEMLDKEFNRVLRADGHLSLVVMDIDLFKNVNDTFGHKTGDYVLIAIAKYLESSVRVSDFCCRYGGEEFVLVMPTASLEIAAERAEHLRKTLEALQFNDGEKQIRLTASFGIATYPHHAQNIDDLLSRADQALYLSKQSGRNKVTTWQ
jgi:diguanylate cyclase (GGDEF)-like protein